MKIRAGIGCKIEAFTIVNCINYMLRKKFNESLLIKLEKTTSKPYEFFVANTNSKQFSPHAHGFKHFKKYIIKLCVLSKQIINFRIL